MTRCDHGGRPCPRLYQATPVQNDVDRPSRGVATLIVAAVFLLLVIADGLVPRIVELLSTGVAR